MYGIDLAQYITLKLSREDALSDLLEIERILAKLTNNPERGEVPKSFSHYM